MKRTLIAGAAIVAVLASAAAGYRLGAGGWPNLRSLAGGGAGEDTPAKASSAKPAAERAVLYWKDPDGKNDFSQESKKTADGRDYIPVYEDEEAGLKSAKPAKKPEGNRKVLYYRNPMGLADTSPAPKKDSMGMDYIPVYEGEEEEDGSTVKISLARIQRAGVRTGEARMQRLPRFVRAPGVAKPDERTLRQVTLRADGFIEKLYANETGRQVKAGEPLFRVYSPQMVSAQVDFRTAVTSQTGLRDEHGALQRLKNLDVPEIVQQRLRLSPNPATSIDWPSPMTGVILEKKVVEGQMMKAGEEIFLLGDLNNIWVIADIPEQDVGQVKVGDPAKVAFRALPGRVYEGRVTFVLHELDAATRTAKARIEIANDDHAIKHEMYADVSIDAGARDAERLVAPASAVIDSGDRQVVLVERGEGRFEPRAVKIGMRSEGWIEIREGLKPGERIVVAANFLIDAESNLKAALRSFTAEPAAGAEAKP